MTVQEVTESDFDDWQRLALALWPDHEPGEMQAILRDIYQSSTQTAFLVRDGQGRAIGFMNLSLRTDYVPGATHRPVAYLEGIYVQPIQQRQGIGQALVGRAEVWARGRGSCELASDVEWGNDLSEAFHHRAGFEEVDRVISFIKKLPD